MAHLQSSFADVRCSFPLKQATREPLSKVGTTFRQPKIKSNIRSKTFRVFSFAEDGERKYKSNKTLSSNLLYPQGRLPPEGRSLFPEDEFCEPEIKFCREPLHIYEEPCDCCQGTGSVTFATKKGTTVGTCLKCSGLGYTRIATTRAAPDFENGSGKLTLQREPEDAVKRAKLEKNKKQ